MSRNLSHHSPVPRNIQPAIVTVGDELVFGERSNDNQRWLCHYLWELGHPAHAALSLPDDISTISSWIRHLVETGHFPILVSGGIGGTHDDCTRQAIAVALGRELVKHQTCFRILEKRYRKTFNAQRQRMAWLPEGAVLISNPFGAPGFHIDGIYAFPGFPHMLRPMVEDTLPHIVGPNDQASSWIVRELELSVPEGEIAAEIEAFARQHPEGRLGLYPSLQSGSPKVTIRLRVSERNSHVLRDFENLVDKLNAKFN